MWADLRARLGTWQFWALASSLSTAVLAELARRYGWAPDALQGYEAIVKDAALLVALVAGIQGPALGEAGKEKK